jgi:VWFA-related protein
MILIDEGEWWVGNMKYQTVLDAGQRNSASPAAGFCGAGTRARRAEIRLGAPRRLAGSVPFRLAAISALVLFAALLGEAQQPPQAAQPPGDDQTVIRVDVDLVNILFTVRTKKGQLVPDLEKNDFELYEDGKKQEIQRFSKETDLPVTLGLLIDISASQGRLIDIERDAASAFFSSVIRQKDEAFLISFGKSTDLLQDFTSSPRLLKAGLKDLRVDGGGPMVTPGTLPQMGKVKGTVLFDAVYLASTDKLRGEVGRKAIVLITDGDDQGSFYSVKDAVEQAQKSDAIVYSFYYVDPYFYSRMGMYSGGGEGDLKKMSSETGGHVFTVDKKHTLDDAFKDLQEELRNQYSIGYVPTNTSRDGSFRHIDIKVTRPDLVVQARKGYYATRSDVR